MPRIRIVLSLTHENNLHIDAIRKVTGWTNDEIINAAICELGLRYSKGHLMTEAETLDAITRLLVHRRGVAYALSQEKAKLAVETKAALKGKLKAALKGKLKAAPKGKLKAAPKGKPESEPKAKPETKLNAESKPKGDSKATPKALLVVAALLIGFGSVGSQRPRSRPADLVAGWSVPPDRVVPVVVQLARIDGSVDGILDGVLGSRLDLVDARP